MNIVNVESGSSSSGKCQSMEENRDNKEANVKLNAAQRALEALKDFDISGISLLKDQDSMSLKTDSGSTLGSVSIEEVRYYHFTFEIELVYFFVSMHMSINRFFLWGYVHSEHKSPRKKMKISSFLSKIVQLIY